MKTICSILLLSFTCLAFVSCGKDSGSTPPPPVVVASFSLTSASIDEKVSQPVNYFVEKTPVIKFSFPKNISRTSAASAVSLSSMSGQNLPFSLTYENDDKSLIIKPGEALAPLSKFTVNVSTALKSVEGGSLSAAAQVAFITSLDSSRKFPAISDSALLTLVQQQTFKYFWDFGHPVSGLARERNTSDNVVTSGGSGFGIMSIVVAINRNFITRAQGLERLQKITAFLKNNAQKFHGAFPHWLDGGTGAVIKFSDNDNGADLVETSFLLQGLLTARQYFNDAGVGETALRNDINSIYNDVEWDWFRKNSEDVLYWHWSPNYEWAINQQIKGWNECLVTYVLAASSTTHSIPKSVYDAGWASNGNIRNNNIYQGITLPLGPTLGGPLFFAHYSFLGINPIGLSDAYGNYQTQNTNHTLINYNYCRTNSTGANGYSDSVWGLTASDIPTGYSASSPTNDLGVIAPTAALSSFPYAPVEAMKALHFYYYVLGDKLWKAYGFVDAFSLKDQWFAGSSLAIDQGPVIVMIENYRSGLLWNLFTSCPEVKAGMKKLGFTAPYL